MMQYTNISNGRARAFDSPPVVKLYSICFACSFEDFEARSKRLNQITLFGLSIERVRIVFERDEVRPGK